MLHDLEKGNDSHAIDNIIVFSLHTFNGLCYVFSWGINSGIRMMVSVKPRVESEVEDRNLRDVHVLTSNIN